MGFTRETDRLVGQLNHRTGPDAWRRDAAPVDLKRSGYAPAEHYAIPARGQWEAEYYLDQAVARGLSYDSQLLGHCSGVRFREPWLDELTPRLQWMAQWLGRYPSFYGFNYNDEMFFGGFASDWVQADVDWLKAVQAGKLAGHPWADVLMYALRTMYGTFNRSVRQVLPTAHITATPMWQFPAVDGSYPPVIYEGMTETYSHFLSEGYHYPWYPAHSVEFLRRPGLPLMGVFDNSYSGPGDGYLQDLMQVLGRGVQGAGVQHTRPFRDAAGASAYRLGNQIARDYGAVFAQAPPANEATVLYSWTQDISESRNSMGTPHWERVFAICGAGLMAGVPMGIVCEEDLAAGWLLDGSVTRRPESARSVYSRTYERDVIRIEPARPDAGARPRTPMLFLVGQTKALPPKVAQAVAAYAAAGGKVFTDADSADFPAAEKLTFHTHELKSLFHEGYAADTIYPLFQPVMEKLAADLHAAVGKHRRFPVDSDTPWVARNVFDGGAVRYVMLATD
jgi:hypothetical protein